MKKSLPIDSLLRWAYRDELPKRETLGSWGPSQGFAKSAPLQGGTSTTGALARRLDHR